MHSAGEGRVADRKMIYYRVSSIERKPVNHILETEMELAVALDTVFAFFSQAENLARITPPELQFQITTPTPIEIREGTLINYRMSLFGVSFGWETKITRYEAPHIFIDEQIRGPYAVWVHTHTFEERGSVTCIRDQVRYRLPFYPLGEVVHPLVRMQLERIFAYRKQAVRAALEAQR